MILNKFPDLEWLKKQAERSFADKRGVGGIQLPQEGWPTVILNVETEQTYRNNIRGPLSIFTNLSGESRVETGSRSVKVKEDFFFVTNQDQYYTLEIEKYRTTTFNIHFGEYFADHVFSSMSSSTEKLLDENIFARPFERMEFCNTLYRKSHEFDQVINEIKKAGSDNLLLEEKLYSLMSVLLREDQKIQKLKHQIPVIKHATREELTRRLLRAADYIHSHYDKDLSLEELGNISCLSKFHFLRLFKLAFQQTPHQYINDVRITRAKHILKQRNDGVSEIARKLGFNDASSFSRMFYNQVGVYPTQYR